MELDDVYGPTTVVKEYKRTIEHVALVRDYWDEVTRIKELIANGQNDDARALFHDIRSISEIVRIGLWRATTKGGCWTIEERKVLKPNE